MKSIPPSSPSGVFGIFGLILAGCLAAPASAQQAGTLSSAAGWTTAGAVMQSGATTEAALVISAGGQVFRSYDAENLSVRLVSRPYFGEKSENSPLLEIGSVGVAFVRDSGNGGLLLVAEQVVPLPFRIPLEADGRSAQTLDLRLRLNRTTSVAELTLGDLTHSAKGAKETGPLEVSISAGAIAMWDISAMEVTATGGSSSSTDNRNPSASGSSLVASDARKARKESRANAQALFRGGKDAQAEETLSKGNRTPSGTGHWHAESAHALTMLAIEFARQGEKKTAMRIVDRALAQIEQVTAKADASETSLLANSFELEGFIAERFLGDWTRAKGCYERALKNNPESTAAKAEFSRLEHTETRIVIPAPGRG